MISETTPVELKEARIQSKLKEKKRKEKKRSGALYRHLTERNKCIFIRKSSHNTACHSAVIFHLCDAIIVGVVRSQGKAKVLRIWAETFFVFFLFCFVLFLLISFQWSRVVSDHVSNSKCTVSSPVVLDQADEAKDVGEDQLTEVSFFFFLSYIWGIICKRLSVRCCAVAQLDLQVLLGLRKKKQTSSKSPQKRFIISGKLQWVIFSFLTFAEPILSFLIKTFF